jgi:hypothetical protein
MELFSRRTLALNGGQKKTWRNIVVQYYPLALIVPSDKLPALPGLSEHMRRSSNQTYLAGLWKNSLPLDLLWYRESTSRTLQQPSLGRKDLAWRALSWSWASVDGKIMYDQQLYTQYGRATSTTVFCEVLHAECTAASQSAAGQVTAGHIELSCSILPVQYRHGQLILENNLICFSSDDRIELGGTALYIIRVAQLQNYQEQRDIFLVLKAVEISQKKFSRVCLASSAHANGSLWLEEMDTFPWPEKKAITII